MKLLAEMTWCEAEKAFEKTKVGVIPTGSIEQHGPHLPLGTDYYIADYIAKKLVEKTDVIVTPVIPVGFAPYHQDFSGSLAVEPGALEQYYLAVANSLILHGATHILFINGHGGNMPTLSAVCRNLRDRGIVAAHSEWWFITANKGYPLLGHGDINETSMMLHITPNHVDMTQAGLPVNKKLTDRMEVLDGTGVKFEGGVVNFFLRMRDVTDTGDMLEIGHSADADFTISCKDATAKQGEETFDLIIDYMVDFVEEFKKVSFKPFEA